MAAKKNIIEEKPAAAYTLASEIIRMHLPAGKQPGRIVGSDVAAVPELVRLLKEEAKVIEGNNHMPNKILAILEQRDGMIKRSGFEAASVAFNLAKDLKISAETVVVGDSISNIDEISKYGIQKVYHLKSSSLSNYSSSGYSEAITNVAKEFAYDILILPNTTLGKDLAPRISIQLEAACLVDCVKISLSGDEIIFTRPAYAGKALTDVKLGIQKPT